MFRELRASVTLFILFMLVTGLLYPLLVLNLGQKLFPYQAAGSLLTVDGKPIGSPLIGQNFTSPIYFHPRPSAAGTGYDAANSSGSNLGPTSPDLMKALMDRVSELKNNEASSLIPIDLVTTSGSGLDPDISPAAARFQMPRIAQARNLSQSKLEELIQKQTEPRSMGLLGENRVNVLLLNQALDQLASQSNFSPQ